MTRTFLVGVRGESYDNENGSSRQELIRHLRSHDRVALEPDPTNSHDRWAVKVLNEAGEQVGWLPSDARDADTLLRGEPISAVVHAVTGGTNWLRRLLGKKSVGLVLRITKDDPDWSRRDALEKLAKPYDAKVEAALQLEKTGNDAGAIEAMQSAIAEIRGFTDSNRQASAHRSVPLPIDRLSLLLERKKDYAGALAVITQWEQQFDPVQPTKAVADSIRKRAARLRLKVAS